MIPDQMLSTHAMRDRQLAWALAGAIPREALETRHGKISWVLKHNYRRLNLYRRDWWKYIQGTEHRWARALNSSQCFAVNLFAPLAEEPERARKALALLLPNRPIDDSASVSVCFEFTPSGAAAWLGERGQATQVDVYFRITREDQCRGHALVEVKFSKSSFGSCRGWKPKTENPDRELCRDVLSILSAPQTNCWLAKSEGRKYWDIMKRPNSSVLESALRRAGPCPFRYGLYQLMRNRVLADLLLEYTGADWADFAVCVHPANQTVLGMRESISSTTDVFEAFRSLSSSGAVLDWNARQVLATIAGIDDSLGDWERWMSVRYFEGPRGSSAQEH